MTSIGIHPTAVVDPGAEIGAGTKIWHFCHVMPGARIGARCVLGQNVFVGGAAVIGDGCKLENNVSVFDAVRLEAEVFVGPSAVFTNVRSPRAFLSRKAEFQPTRVGRGASIGANATIVCGRTLGPYCFVAAGAVVTHDVPAHALVAGVPARWRGWVCVCGVPLRGAAAKPARLRCLDCRRQFVFKPSQGGIGIGIGTGSATDGELAPWPRDSPAPKRKRPAPATTTATRSRRRRTP